jgi:hypothetical protein
VRVTFKAIADYAQAQLDATKGLTGQAIQVRRDYAYNVPAPYVVLSAASLSHHDEEGMAGPDPDESGGVLRATCVHSTTDGARWVADRLRSVLSPGLAAVQFAIPGHAIEVVWDGALGDVVVDRDVTLPNSNTHPGVALEEYVFSSLPVPVITP